MAVGTMTDREFQDWLNQHGGEKGRADETKQNKVQNPQDGSESTVETVQTTVTAGDGATIVLRRVAPSGDASGGPAYEIVSRATAPASADPGAAASDANAVELQRQREANKALPPEQDPAYETDAERRARGRQTVLDQQSAAEKATAAAKAATSGGSVMERPDGVYLIRPDGSTVKTNLPAKPQPSSHTTVKGEDGATYVVTVDADGKVSSQVAIPAQSPGAPAPSSATDWRPDLSLPDLGMFDRRKAVAGMLESGVFGDPASKQAQDKALELLKGDFELAKTTATNVGNIQTGGAAIYAGGITQRGQDTSTATNRLQAATSTFNQTIKDIMADAGKVGSGDTVVNALNAILSKSEAFAKQFGGLTDYDRIEPGANMARTSPAFQGAPPPTPRPPGTGLESGGAVGFGGPTPAPAPPGTGLESGGAVGFGGADPNAPTPPPVPTAPFTPPPTGAPTSMADRAMWAQQLFGGGSAAPAAPAAPTTPVAGPDFAAQAAAGQALVGQRAPTTGGTLAWSRQLGFPEDVIAQFMAIEDGPQVAAA